MHGLVTPKRFDIQGSRFCLLLLCPGKKGAVKLRPLALPQQERSWWRWHSWTRRSPRRPPIMTKPNDHHRGLMRGPRRHRSRERTRTGGSIDTRQTRIEAQLHRKRMKHRETKRTSRGKWRCMRVKIMVELGVQMSIECEASLRARMRSRTGAVARHWFPR